MVYLLSVQEYEQQSSPAIFSSYWKPKEWVCVYIFCDISNISENYETRSESKIFI